MISILTFQVTAGGISPSVEETIGLRISSDLYDFASRIPNRAHEDGSENSW
jgi:hypothetical protein